MHWLKYAKLIEKDRLINMHGTTVDYELRSINMTMTMKLFLFPLKHLHIHIYNDKQWKYGKVKKSWLSHFLHQYITAALNQFIQSIICKYEYLKKYK